MADYARLINKLKETYDDLAVIVTGWSYGGMIASWMRVKFPHLIDGAIPASAPNQQLYPVFTNTN